jgi:hypothetical protein
MTCPSSHTVLLAFIAWLYWQTSFPSLIGTCLLCYLLLSGWWKQWTPREKVTLIRMGWQQNPITWTLQMVHLSHYISQLCMATVFHFLMENFCLPYLGTHAHWMRGQSTQLLTVGDTPWLAATVAPRAPLCATAPPSGHAQWSPDWHVLGLTDAGQSWHYFLYVTIDCCFCFFILTKSMVKSELNNVCTCE